MGIKAMMKGVEIFVSYAHEDEVLRDQLAKQLREWERQEVIRIWKSVPAHETTRNVDNVFIAELFVLIRIHSNSGSTM